MKTRASKYGACASGANKGLLAMDESDLICNKRFARVGIPQAEEARRAYRELL
jgi:fructose-bisphosphate aldolase class I